MKTILASGLSLMLAAGAIGQVSATAGPSPAPLGCPIAISVANDTSAGVFLGSPCPFRVRNSAGAVIYNPICIAIIVNVNPGAVFTTYWPQISDSGAPVPAGTYFVDVFLPGGAMTTIQVNIDAAEDAALAPLGPNRVGTTRGLYLCAPQDAGFPYAMAASGPPVSGGVPTCGGVVPLELDALLYLSIGPNPFFLNFTGTLGGTGSTSAPAISVPNIPGLAGTSFFVASVTLDPNAACIVRSVSAPLLVVIL